MNDGPLLFRCPFRLRKLLHASSFCLRGREVKPEITSGETGNSLGNGMVLGCENQEWWDFKDGFAEKSVIATDERRKDPRNFQEILVEPLDEKMKLAQFYQYLMKCEQNNNIMGASIDCETEEQRPDGLVAGHAYTIMKVTTAMTEPTGFPANFFVRTNRSIFFEFSLRQLRCARN